MNVAARIIGRFGGLRKMARALKLPPTTVQTWSNSGFIPARRQQAVLDAARALGIALAPEDFFEPRPTTAPEDATEHTRASAAA